MKPEKTRGSGLPVTTRPNKQRPGVNLHGRALYSDGRRSELQAGSHPNSPCYIFFPGQRFCNREQSVMRGFEMQGKVALKNRSIPALGS